MTAVVDVLPEQPTRDRRGGGVARRVVWVVLLTLAGALFGVALASQVPAAYVAEGSLLVQPLVGNAFDGTGGNQLVNLETESHVVSSDAVLRRVTTSGPDLPTAQVIRNRLSIDVVPNAEVIQIRYSGSSPAQSRDMVERIAAATLAERVERANAANAQRLQVISDLRELADQQRVKEPTDAQELLYAQRAAQLDAQEVAARAPVDTPGRLITVVQRGDAHATKLRYAIVGGCALVGALLGLWVGGAPARRHRDGTGPGQPGWAAPAR